MQERRSDKFLLTRPSRDVTGIRFCISIRHRISTHTPLAGRDVSTGAGTGWIIQFLLTRPSRDVTLSNYGAERNRKISTHTPLAGRDEGTGQAVPQQINFYSHAPRGT